MNIQGDVKPKKIDKSQVFLRSIHDEFESNGDVPKNRQIRNLIRKNIENGQLKPNDILPTAMELARTFGVTRFTVDRAINDLANEGMVYRVQGKGTYVRMTIPPITMKEVVGVIMAANGDVWDVMIRTLIRGLSQKHLHCMLEDFNIPEETPLTDQQMNRLRRIVGSKPSTLVIRGIAVFPFELLRNYTGQLIFTDCFEGDKKYKANYVLADYRLGGKLVGDHLLSLGHTRILFDGPKLQPWQKANLDVLEGLKDAYRQKGISAENILFTENEVETERLLASSERPDAVFCLWDYRAKSIYEIAERLDLNIPGDLAVVGYFNTPWCMKFLPHLTSVYINEEKIATEVLNVISSDNRQQWTIIKPTLIIRDSCGAR